MTGVVNLVPAREPDPDLIRYLEAALERARSGEIVGVLMLQQDVTGCVRYTIANIKDRFKVLGFLSHAMHSLQEDK